MARFTCVRWCHIFIRLTPFFRIYYFLMLCLIFFIVRCWYYFSCRRSRFFFALLSRLARGCLHAFSSETDATPARKERFDADAADGKRHHGLLLILIRVRKMLTFFSLCLLMIFFRWYWVRFWYFDIFHLHYWLRYCHRRRSAISIDMSGD